MEASQGLKWDQLDDMPVGHWEPASLVLDGKLVVLGGYEDYVTSSKRVDLFDPADVGPGCELRGRGSLSISRLMRSLIPN